MKGKDAQTDEAIYEWESTLALLERDPMRLAYKLDWVAKKKMLMEYMDSEGVEWGDDVLHSLDLEYHNINSATGLYYGLEELGEAHRMLTDDQIQSATKTPPQNTRAKGRADVISQLITHNWAA